MFQRDLEDFGLASYVDAVVCSGDTGFYKPHPSTFERVLALLDVPPSATVMVGDDCRGDMEGGRAAAMRTVWKLNGRYDAPPCEHADYAIHDLAELLALPLVHRDARPLVSTESLTPHEDGNEDRY
jgi:putative hydrolase of the HAD superfamily